MSKKAEMDERLQGLSWWFKDLLMQLSPNMSAAARDIGCHPNTYRGYITEDDRDMPSYMDLAHPKAKEILQAKLHKLDAMRGEGPQDELDGVIDDEIIDLDVLEGEIISRVRQAKDLRELRDVLSLVVEGQEVWGRLYREIENMLNRKI